MAVLRHNRIFNALNSSGCRFVVVGGLAAVLQGVNRLTVDVDLVVDLMPESAEQAVNALTSLGYQPQVPVEAIDFADPDKRRSWISDKGMKVFTLWDPLNDLPNVDLFVEYPIEFNEMLRLAKDVDLGDQSIKIACIDHLIKMKQDAGRDKDLHDIAQLSRIKRRTDD